MRKPLDPAPTHQPSPRRFEVGPVPVNVSDYPFIDLVNSLVADHTGSSVPVDRLEMAGWRRWFMTRYGLSVNERRLPVSLPKLRQFRHELRSLLENWHATGQLRPADRRRMEGWLAKCVTRPSLDRESKRISLTRIPQARDWDWFIGAIAESAATMLSSLDPVRLKVCDNGDCRFMFYDRTRNHSRRWCSGGYCGNLLRVREYRRRDSATC
jgi:predicted RNA-binding Zn ribbon-like protein